jgi:hypothetical protein
MSEESTNVEHRKEKACVCRFAPTSGLFLRPTHKHDQQGRNMLRCWLCGRTGYRTA